MGARDPQTGQFVSSGSTGLGYDDHEVQTITSNYELEAAQADGTEENNVEPAAVWEPAGGLNRGQKAELVAFHLRTWQSVIEVTQSAEGQTFQRFELTDGATSHTVDNQDKIGGQTPALENSDVQGNYFEYVGGDRIIYHGQQTGAGSFADSATGVAGGADHVATSAFVNYRHQFGQGPIMDRNDQLYEHISLDVVNVDDASAEMDIAYALYWRVFDE
jgi:hypothetical protein